MNLKLSTLVDLIPNIILASALALMLVGGECPIADSITAGLVLMIVLTLIDMREE